MPLFRPSFLAVAALGVFAAGCNRGPSSQGPVGEQLAVGLVHEIDHDPTASPTLAAYRNSLVPPIEIPGLTAAIDHELTEEDAAAYFDQLASVSDFSHDTRASFHAHGEQICASGCAASRHPTERLTKQRLMWLLKRYSEGPLNETNPGLEGLLYFGRQTTAYLNGGWSRLLPAEHLDFLRQELTTTHARIKMRLVDEHGEIRSHLPPTRVPFDRRHVFDMEVNRLQPLVTSGTVKRVGLYHLWTRL